jgi:hypothetical protein
MADNDVVEWVLLDTNLTTRLAILPVLSSHLYIEFQEPGSGEIKIPLDSIAAGLVANGQFAQCWYRGAARGGFFVDNIKISDAGLDEGGGRVLSISGRGLLALLDEAIVWQDGSGATERNYTAQTMGAVLSDLIDEAQARGALGILSYTFSSTADSTGTAWTDSEDLSLPVGTTLLDVVRQFARTGEMEFDISLSSSDFSLGAYKAGIGSDLTESIFFRIGTNCQDVGSDERGDQIHNAMLVKYKDGYTFVSSTDSIASRRRREELLSLGTAQSADSANTYAAAKLDQDKDPHKSIALQVYDGVGARLFLDYDLGDTVTLDRFGVESEFRVLGIQCSFDGPEMANVVVEMNFLHNDWKVESDLDWLMNQWNTARDGDLTEVKQWLSIGSPDGPVYALLYSGNYLYVGGDFENITGRLTTSNVARYNVTTGAWEALASGISDPVTAIVEHGGDVYAATDQKVYHWTAGAWSLIGTTVGTIKAMASFGSNLYVGGQSMKFDTGTDFCRVVYWDGSAPWNVSTAGLGTPNCLALAVYNGDLYGGFDTSLNTALRHLNGGAWSTVMVAPTDSTRVKALVEAGDYLYYTGSGKMYRWDGVSSTREDLFTVTTWADPGGNTHDALAAYLSDVYLGSVFTSVDGAAGYGNLVKYSGGILNDLLDGVSTGVGDRLNAIAVVGSDAYIGGTFSTAGGKAMSNLAVWITDFRSLVTHLTNGSQFDMGAAIHAATAITTPTDNDEFPLWEDTTQDLRKVTWANIKSTLITLFDTMYSSNSSSDITITDAGGYFTSTDVEGALQELGAGSGANSIPDDGWIPISDTWTRTGNHTFTVSGDVTATYRKGTKIRYKDGGSYEYGVVASSSHAAGTTTITLITNSDYAMAAATITDTYISYIENPEGWPDSFSFTPVWSAGITIGDGTQTGEWKTVGNKIFVSGALTFGSTTSVSGDSAMNLPVTAAAPGESLLPIGWTTLRDASTSTTLNGSAIMNSTTGMIVRAFAASGSYVGLAALSSIVPFTWATGDKILFTYTYLF